MRVRAIIISNAGRLLFGIDQSDYYVLPGGKIKEGEHPVDALFREIQEETGLKDFESIEYLWPFLGNHVFICVPQNAMLQQISCANDPSKEFKALEWVNLDALPGHMDNYAEDIIYRFLRVEILHKGSNMKSTTANHIDVLIDGKKAFQLDDDTIWLTLPRLAQERSKGKKIEFKQVLDDGTVVDQTPEPMPVKNKEAVSYLKEMDIAHFKNWLVVDCDSQLLNPDVQILKMADTFDNNLLFDGKDEFWITHCSQPIWRSNYMDRYAPYEEVVQKWNEIYPKNIIDLDWFKDLLKKMMQHKSLKVAKAAKSIKKKS